MRSRPSEPARHSPLLTQATTVPASQRKEEQELGWRAGRGGSPSLTAQPEQQDTSSQRATQTSCPTAGGIRKRMQNKGHKRNQEMEGIERGKHGL